MSSSQPDSGLPVVELRRVRLTKQLAAYPQCRAYEAVLPSGESVCAIVYSGEFVRNQSPTLSGAMKTLSRFESVRTL